MSAVTAEERLKELGIALPKAPTPLGACVEAVQDGQPALLEWNVARRGGQGQICWARRRRVDAGAGSSGSPLLVSLCRMPSTRAVVGVASLPLGACVETEILFEVSGLTD